VRVATRPHALGGIELRILHLYTRGRYLQMPADRIRSLAVQTSLHELRRRGYVTVDGDPSSGEITVTDEGRAYAAAHPVR
jgi:hypothetical protein